MELKILDTKEFIKLIPNITKLFRYDIKDKGWNDFSEDYFRWRYIDNPVRDLLFCVAIDNGKIVASYSGSPCYFIINNNKALAVLTLTGGTHPDYQRQGVIVATGKKLRAYIREKGYKMNFCFPNHISHRIITKTPGWKDVYEIPMMQLYMQNLKDIPKFSTDTDDDFKLNYDDSSHLSGLNSVQKNQAYLKWRYKENPINTYLNFVLHYKKRVSSFMVVKRYQNRLNIIDFQAKDPEEGERLLLTAINYAQSLKLDMVTTWAPRHSFFHTLCERQGFRNNAPITYFNVWNIGEDRLELSTNYSDWYIQLGDFNAY